MFKHIVSKALFSIVAALVLFGVVATPALAADSNPRYASLVVDANTGEVLRARYADAIRHPASLTKVMTLYLTFEALEDGRLRLHQSLPVSAVAAGMPSTNLSLKKGDTISVDSLIRGLVVRSANDGTVVLAEALAGSEAAFAVKMTDKARQLGMKKTVFKNSNGLPNKAQVTTATDLAILAKATMRDFPQYYPYFSLKSFRYNGRTYTSHNRLVGKYPGMDGMKTGFINASGFNLVSSAVQDGHRLIGVVLGGRTGVSRNDHMAKILDEGFAALRQRGGRGQAVAASPMPVLGDDSGVDVAVNVPLPLPKPVSGTDTGAEMQVAVVTQPGVDAALQSGQDGAGEDVATAPSPLPVPPPMSENAVRGGETGMVVAMAGGGTNMAAPVPAHVQPSASVPFGEAVQQAAEASNVVLVNLPVPPTAPPIQAVVQTPVESPVPSPVNEAEFGGSGAWGIQVGAFSRPEATLSAMQQVTAQVPNLLLYAEPKVEPVSFAAGAGTATQVASATLYRGRFMGLDENTARRVCSMVPECAVVRP